DARAVAAAEIGDTHHPRAGREAGVAPRDGNRRDRDVGVLRSADDGLAREWQHPRPRDAVLVDDQSMALAEPPEARAGERNRRPRELVRVLRVAARHDYL